MSSLINAGGGIVVEIKDKKAPKTKAAKPVSDKTKAKKAVKNDKVMCGKFALRSAQVRILQKLEKKPDLSRKELCELCKVDPAWIGAMVGSDDKEMRELGDKKYHLSLWTLGLVKAKKVERDNRTVTVFVITDKGKKVIAG